MFERNSLVIATRIERYDTFGNFSCLVTFADVDILTSIDYVYVEKKRGKKETPWRSILLKNTYGTQLTRRKSERGEEKKKNERKKKKKEAEKDEAILTNH